MTGMANGNLAPSVDAQGYGSAMVCAEGIGRSKESGNGLKWGPDLRLRIYSLW